MTSSEGELVHALAADRDSFLAFVRGRVRTEADAEDILQQGLIKAAAHASAIREPDKVRSWFFQILRNLIADHHARTARDARSEPLPEEGEGELEAPMPEEAKSCACCLRQLDTLRAEYADILRRVDLDEQSLSEVASALGITINNATVRLHRARKALREQLVAYCGTSPGHSCRGCECG
ncbi:MAG: sigma-70 family RNA polymerase sigma factor [Labilithrix sp.]|nr:sigma-70 family RNA polymerase sigma factor [Labilithrix sp.]